MTAIEVRAGLRDEYPDVLSPRALELLEALAPLDERREAVMAARLQRRAERIREGRGPDFLDPGATIPGSEVRVADARAGRFTGSPIPRDLQRQWVQGTGPATRPRERTERSIRNVAYALLSGADGWMFDGEDALGQTDTMSLDNQRNLRLAFTRDPLFLRSRSRWRGEMNAWAEGFFGRRTIEDWRTQLDFTTRIFRARGAPPGRPAPPARRRVRASPPRSWTPRSMWQQPRAAARGRSSIVLYLPKIQTAEEAASGTTILGGVESALGLEAGAVKTYVLVEQLEACFQLDGDPRRRSVGASSASTRGAGTTSTASPTRWRGSGVREPEHRGDHDDLRLHAHLRGSRAPRREHGRPAGQFALWQGGMEPNIPVGSRPAWRRGWRGRGGRGARAAAGASGKWVAHWKMVHIVRPVWEQAGRDNQLGRTFPPLTYTAEAMRTSPARAGPAR
jgi:malate synthase